MHVYIKCSNATMHTGNKEFSILWFKLKIVYFLVS